MKNRKDTAFTVELLGLFILLTMVITTVAGVFVMSRSHSLEAKRLNEAVILAQNAAEVSSAAPDDASLQDMLKDMDNNTGNTAAQREISGEEGSWNAIYASVKKDGASSDDLFIVCVTRRYPEGRPAERTDKGAYAEDTIEVYAAGTAGSDDLNSLEPSALRDPVYTLTSGTYFGSDSYTEEGGRP